MAADAFSEGLDDTGQPEALEGHSGEELFLCFLPHFFHGLQTVRVQVNFFDFLSEAPGQPLGALGVQDRLELVFRVGVAREHHGDIGRVGQELFAGPAGGAHIGGNLALRDGFPVLLPSLLESPVL